MTASWGLVSFARALRRLPERLLHPLQRRKALGRLRGGSPPQFVLVVCHGNMCRSPYVAARLEQELTRPARGAIRIESAGFVGWGRPCPPVAVEVAAAHGVDLSSHLATMLVPSRVSAADLIVVMDNPQAQVLRDLFGRADRDVLILGDLDPERIETRTIQDPMEQSKEVFERCYARIDRCVRELVQAIAGRAERTRSSHSAAPLTQPELTT